MLNVAVYNPPYGILWKQDSVAFMSQPYWVEVEIEAEVDLSLRLKWGWIDVKVNMRLSWNLFGVDLSLDWVELGLRWVGIELSVG